MQVVSIAEVGDVRVALHCDVDLLQHFVRLLLRQFMVLLLLVLALLAHQDLLEFLGQDVDVAGKEGEEIRVVEVDVEVQSLFLVRARQVYVHCVGDVLAEDGDGLC